MPPTIRRPTLEAILKAPWAILPTTLSRIVDWGRQPVAVQVEAPAVLALDGPHGGATRAGGVSVIPVYGVIEHRSDWMLEMFGGVSVDGLRESLRTELNDSSVKAVVLDIDSPGGTVAGVTELAAEIRGARGGTKPIVAVVNTLAASAAYWLAAQADELVVMPSGQVGSIGIYAVHEDVSRMLDEMGVTVTIVSAGEHKSEGNQFEPLSDEARADLQARVDASYAQFVADVAAGRRTTAAQVEESYGGGRMLIAKKALAAGMVDRIATLAQTVARLDRATFGGGRRMAAAAALLELEAKAIGRHKTATSEGDWDAAANEARLPSPMTVAKAHAAYAWLDEDRIEDGEIVKDACRFIHAEVSADGDPGAANLTACSTGIGVLNGGRGGTTIPADDRQGVYDHLAGHLRDADREPPPLTGEAPFTERLVAWATQGSGLIEAAQHRARSRAAAHRPAFSTTIEAALRVSRDAIDALLNPGEPEPAAPPTAEPGEPASAAVPIKPAVPAPAARRFASDEEWLDFLMQQH